VEIGGFVGFCREEKRREDVPITPPPKISDTQRPTCMCDLHISNPKSMVHRYTKTHINTRNHNKTPQGKRIPSKLFVYALM
jgi:hypothetical protein